MATVIETSRLASQPRQGLGARIVRRLGGAVRNAIAGGLSLAGARRRPVASQPDIGHAVARDPEARPAPGQAPRARRPRNARPAPPSQPARPGWLARVFGGGLRRPAPSSGTPLPDDDWTPLTPEAYPGLSPEFCAILNTPLDELDPEILRMLLAAFSETVARQMPADSDLSDARQLFSTLWRGFSAVLDDASLDVPLAAAPVTPAEELPAASVVTPDLPAPPVHVEAFPAAPAASLESRPGASSPALLVIRGISLHICNYNPCHRICWLFHYCRAFFRRGLLQHLSLRHWCYAARASPA